MRKDYILTARRVLTAVLACVAMISAYGEEKIDLTPRLHGTFRARWEGGLDGEGSRFQVRNARVSIDGAVAPGIDYFFQTDLCDRGKMKILDAWGRIAIAGSLKFQAGQFRMPFGTDCFRGPGNYLFSNRSFLGKQMCNVRAVGAKLSYAPRLSSLSSLQLEAGAFNPTSMADHDVWVKTMSYSGKATLTVGDFKVSSGAMTIVPDSVRANLWDVSAGWQSGRWTLEAEYMHKHYTHRAARPAHAWVVWGDFWMPVKAGVFNRASIDLRWDGITAHSSGVRTDGVLTVDHPARQRITAGGTLTYAYKAVRCDLRLDYEKYFGRERHNGALVAAGDMDKIVAEMIIKF
ncbi:MAG: porin [Bacteroides sp.]|nr:porin [Bacteroides sp.]